MGCPKVFIAGLDAATWDLVDPWMKRGLLPNLARLVGAGAAGKMESVMPPLTPPAWTSFMTGCNPGKHGIYNFMEPQADSYAMRYSNAGSRRAPSLWSVLNQAGLTTGVINVPFTYPPEKLDGFQISGMDTPSEKSAFVHPPELRRELETLLGKIDLEIRYLGAMSTDARRDAVLAGMRRLDEQWTRVTLYALEKHPCDVMMVTFMSIDTVQHYFWHHLDPAHFLHDPKLAERYRDAIQQVYVRLDEALGRIVERLPPDCTVVAVSDHGGGPVSDRVVYLNRYFSQHGLLAFKKEKLSPVAKGVRTAVRGVYGLLRGMMTSDQKKRLADLLPALRARFENAATSFSDIDWAHTKAYCSEVLAYPPSVFLNVRGEHPQGTVEPQDRDAVLALITQKLSELRDPRDGSPIIPRIYRREELFHGDHAARGPDLVLDWWSGGGFGVSPSLVEAQGQPALQIRERAPMREPEWSGTHRLHGILAMRGPAVRPGARVEGARLLDLMPTLLYLLGIPVPAGLDGRILTGALEPAWMQAHPIPGEAAPAAAPAAPGTPYTAEEAAEVEEHLRSLGYVD